MMKNFLILVVIICNALATNAQFTFDYLKAADAYFRKKDYASAAEYYEKYLAATVSGNTSATYKPYTIQPTASKKGKANMSSYEQAVYNLAESYRLLNFPTKALPHYQTATAFGADRFPLAKYHAAAQLRALGKFTEAEQAYKDFLSVYSSNDEISKNAERELKNLQFIQEQLKKKDLKYYTLTKAPSNINAAGASYAPAWLNDNTILFTSTRPLDTAAKTKVYTNRLYQAGYTNGTMEDVMLTPIGQESNWHQGVVAVTPDGNTIFLTRWGNAGNEKKSSIWKSSRSDGGWSEPVLLNDLINAPNSNNQQPFVTPDGKYLLFASNRVGGFGGFDIWYAPIENALPGQPKNIGSAINTSFDEQAPFFHKPSGSLIFSTNGRVGMGGFDFFQSKGDISNPGEPVNLGYPGNSIKDDIYFVSKGPAKNILEDVLLSSDREAACCLELFYLKKVRPLKQLRGKILSCDPSKPLSGALVTVVEKKTNKVIYSGNVRADGSYSFVLEDYLTVTITAEAKGYISALQVAGVPADEETETFAYNDLCMVPEPPKVDEKFVIENVYYDYDKAELKPESYSALDEIVRMLTIYPTMEIELSAHTDSKGAESYNQKLSEARAKSVMNYLISKGISAERLKAVGYGELQPVAPNTVNGKDNPDGREKNRRTEFKVLKQ
jgi:OOP family OmpA-OmpF porin